MTSEPDSLVATIVEPSHDRSRADPVDDDRERDDEGDCRPKSVSIAELLVSSGIGQVVERADPPAPRKRLLPSLTSEFIGSGTAFEK